MIDNHAKPGKGGTFIVDAWILFQLSSLEPLPPSLRGSLLLFLAFCSQPAPERSSAEMEKGFLATKLFSFLANNLFRWLASNLDYWEGRLRLILLIISPSSWSLPTTHLGGSWDGAVRTKRKATEPCQVEDGQSSMCNPSPGLSSLLPSIGSAH